MPMTKYPHGIEYVEYRNINDAHLVLVSLCDAERALRAGAKGYIMKAEATEMVIT